MRRFAPCCVTGAAGTRGAGGATDDAATGSGATRGGSGASWREFAPTSDRRPYEKFADGSETCIEDEIPFDLPSGWAWARVASISQKTTDGDHVTPRRVDRFCGYYLLSARNVRDQELWLDDVDLVDKEEYSRIAQRCDPTVGDVLISCSGTIGRVCLAQELKCVMVRSAAMIRPVLIDATYLMFALQSPCVQSQIDSVKKQTAQANLFIGAINQLLIPIPPLTEQIKVVSLVNRLIPKVGEYEHLEGSLSAFNNEFPIALKKAILQSAVEGKLVPQDPNDEPVEKLLERINAERKVLVKTGKLKRDKHESVIFRGSDRLTYETRDGETVCIEDELPFKIPENWAWVRLGAIATIIRGSGIKRDEIVPVGVPCIRYGELYTTYRTQISAIVSHTTEAVARRAKPIKRGDVILTLTGENKEDIGTAAAYLVENDAVVGGDVAVLKDHHCDPLWLSYFLAAPFAVGQKAGMSNGDIIVHLAAQSVASILVPLPPLAEQKRIVVQIEKMLKASATLTT